jgi:hypothetical protein
VSAILKSTTSVCDQCLVKVPAAVIRRDGAVFMKKTCPEHGEQEALLASDEALYFHAPEGVPWGAGGCCAMNHSCTVVIEITDRCNLTCPTCFTASSPEQGWQMSLEEFRSRLDRLLAAGKGSADMIQLSGGEPTVHPDLEAMIAYAFERGMKRVYVNTNGVLLGKDPTLARRLAALDAGKNRLQLYFQLDGQRESTHSLIRGRRGLDKTKARAIEAALDAGLYVLPIMTVTRGINLDEIGDLFRFVVEHHPKMNTLMLQPAFYAGRYENDRGPLRLTMSEVAHEAARQSGVFEARDFGPIPCSDPNCFALAVALVKKDGIVPVSRYFPGFDRWSSPEVAPLISSLTEKMPQTMLEAADGDRGVVDALLELLASDDDSMEWSSYERFVMIGIKPFMDAGTYDQDRIDKCCVHVLDRKGELVSLCEYNTLHRARDRKEATAPCTLEALPGAAE